MFRQMSTTIVIGLVTSAMTAGAANASFDLSDPGLYDPSSYSTLFEARARLDAGDSQTWKTALWSPGSAMPDATSGNFASPWLSGMPQFFELTYDVNSSFAIWMVTLPEPAGFKMTMSTYELEPDHSLAGLRFAARSNADGSSTMLSNLEVSVNGAAYSAIPGLMNFMSGPGDEFAQSGTVHFTEPIQSVAVRGMVSFNWVEDSNLQGDRFRGSVMLLQAAPIPGPAALAGFALLIVICGRRRNS